jgi:hypothetical protein
MCVFIYVVDQQNRGIAIDHFCCPFGLIKLLDTSQMDQAISRGTVNFFFTIVFNFNI